MEREFHCCAHGSRCHWRLLNTSSPSVSCSLAASLRIAPSLGLFVWTRWRDAPLQTFLAQDHDALGYVIQRSVSSVSFCPRALLLPLSLSLLTKTDKGLSFLLARLSSVCLYCTEPGCPSHCAPSLSLQRRCLGAVGPLLGDLALAGVGNGPCGE